MKLAICIVLLSLELADLVDGSDAEENEDDHRVRRYTSDCSARCERLLKRSLERIGYSIKKVDLDAKTKSFFEPEMTDICWKFMDYTDCSNQCEHPSKESRLDELAELVNKRCKVVNRENTHNFRCIHKYHGFIEIRCSSYMNEASKLRQEASVHTKDILQETCRFLHYHNMCLMNTVLFYCPSSKKLFNRFTLRDYFLSFIIPKNDHDFSDQILDYCQVFDFHKMAKDVWDSTSTADSGEAMVTLPMDGSMEVEHVETTTPKKIFDSYEDLEETPPNFFYSSAKVVPTYEPEPHVWSKTPNWTYYQTEDDVHPVEIEFVPHPVDIEGIFDELSKTDQDISMENGRFGVKKTSETSIIPKDSMKMTEKVEEKGDFVALAPTEVIDTQTPTAKTPRLELIDVETTQISSQKKEKSIEKSSETKISIEGTIKTTPRRVEPPRKGTKPTVKTTSTHGTPRTHFTLDPNSLLSTIFRIPALFPTSVVEPDTEIHTTPSLKDITTGDLVTIMPAEHEPSTSSLSSSTTDGLTGPILVAAKKTQVFPEPQMTQDGPLAMTEIFDIRITPEYDENGPIDDEDTQPSTLKPTSLGVQGSTYKVSTTLGPESSTTDQENGEISLVLKPEGTVELIKYQMTSGFMSDVTSTEKYDVEENQKPFFHSSEPTLKPYERTESSEIGEIKSEVESTHVTTSTRPDTTVQSSKSITKSPEKPTAELKKSPEIEKPPPKDGLKTKKPLLDIKPTKPKLDEVPKSRQNALPPIVLSPKRRPTTTTKKPVDRRRPILGGTKIHVKRILHFSEKDEEEEKAKNSAEAIYFGNRALETMNSSISDQTSSPINSTLSTQLNTPELDLNSTSKNNNSSSSEESHYVDFTNTTLIEILLALYSLIFLVGFILLLVFVIRKVIVIRKRRLKE